MEAVLDCPTIMVTLGTSFGIFFPLREQVFVRTVGVVSTFGGIFYFAFYRDPSPIQNSNRCCFRISQGCSKGGMNKIVTHNNSLNVLVMKPEPIIHDMRQDWS